MSLTLHILERLLSFVNEHHFSFLIATFLSLALYFLALRRNLKRKIEELNAKVSEEKTLSRGKEAEEKTLSRGRKAEEKTFSRGRKAEEKTRSTHDGPQGHDVR